MVREQTNQNLLYLKLEDQMEERDLTRVRVYLHNKPLTPAALREASFPDICHRLEKRRKIKPEMGDFTFLIDMFEALDLQSLSKRVKDFTCEWKPQLWMDYFITNFDPTFDDIKALMTIPTGITDYGHNLMRNARELVSKHLDEARRQYESAALYSGEKQLWSDRLTFWQKEWDELQAKHEAEWKDVAEFWEDPKKVSEWKRAEYARIAERQKEEIRRLAERQISEIRGRIEELGIKMPENGHGLGSWGLVNGNCGGGYKGDPPGDGLYRIYALLSALRL